MMGYAQIQGTRPKTLAVGLNDSPVGQLAWIVLDFLATLIGIGGKITDIIKKALKAVTQPIQDGIQPLTDLGLLVSVAAPDAQHRCSPQTTGHRGPFSDSAVWSLRRSAAASWVAVLA